MPDETLNPYKPPVSRIIVEDEDPPAGAKAMSFTAGSAVLIGIIILLLGLLGDCLEQLLTVLGGALIAVGIIGWSWYRATIAKRRRELKKLQAQVDALTEAQNASGTDRAPK